MVELDALREQDFPYQCPYCFEIMEDHHIVGTGTYPFRVTHAMGEPATVFECPHCFEKSFIHTESLQWRIKK